MAAETGAYEYYLTWEDSGTQNYSPRQYDRYIGSEIRQWCDFLNANGLRYIQHACGHVRELVRRMRDCGVYAIESISPPPTGNISIGEARRTVGGDFGIIGGIEPTDFLNLSLDELEPYVEQVIEAARGGAFILANSDSCPPGVSIEKFKLVSQVAERFS
jgi:uroporphyrinogen-III decarboxylase